MNAPSEPIERFAFELARAEAACDRDVTAVTLATADGRGRPSARMVLLKDFDSRGFVFYTNYSSRKADDLAVNPWAALCFFWPEIERQVRVEGPVEKVSAEASDSYFASRDRGSQLGAWASRQSRHLESDADLTEHLARVEARFAGDSVPRPDFWGGYRLTVETIEFWEAGQHRLHRRLLYRRVPAGWAMERLFP